VPVTKPTPLALVLSCFDTGGTERQMTELIRRLDRTRWNVHVACLEARGPWLPYVAEAAPVYEFRIRGFRRPDTCRQALLFARWCTRHDIEVVHTVDFYSNVFALPAAAVARVPVRVGSRRGHNTDRTASQLAMQRAALSCAHAILANSHAVARRLQRERVRSGKVTVIHNGLDLDAFPAAASREPRRRVIVVANLRPEKGYDVLIEAAGRVLRQFPDARFECVGTGPQLASIQAALAAGGISGAFTFFGQRDDVPALLGAADIFVLPSRSESLPNAVLEAMAAGLPVVASAVGGVPEIVDDGRTGLLAPAGDAAALADRLCRLMNDAPLAARLGEAARREVRERYSFDRMVAAVDALYVRELARRGRVRAEMAA
jgi:glycosyltransferase involved in cell wall biosynthesis